MKKNDNTVAKKARKAFKKELTGKISEQLKATVGNIGADTKKTGKAIEKAAKNLAKKLTKQAVIKAPAPVDKAVPAVKAVATPAKVEKTKPATTKKPAATTK